MSPESALPIDDAVLEAWLQEKLAVEVAMAVEGKSPAVGRRFDIDEAVLDAWLIEKIVAEVAVAAERKSPDRDFRIVVNEDDAEEKFGAEVVVAAERKSPAIDRRFDADEAGSEAWLVEEGRNALAVEVVSVPESAHIDFPTDSIVDGGGLPPYDLYVNYLSSWPRFLFYDPKRVEQLWREQPVSKLAAEGKPSAVECRFDTDEDVLSSGGGLPPYDPYVNYLSMWPRFCFYDPKRAELLRRELDFETFLKIDGSSLSHSDDSMSEQVIDEDDDDCLHLIQDEGKGVENGAGRLSAEQFGVVEIAVTRVGEVEEKEGKNAPTVEEPEPESAHIDSPTDFIQDGELEFDGSSSSVSGSSISEQSLGDDSDGGNDDEYSNQQEQKSVEKGVERSSSEQFEVKKDKKRAWCHPSLVLKSFLFLSLMILSLFGASSIYSSSNVAYDHGGVELVVKISIPLSIPSTFSFYKLMKRSFWLPSRSISLTDDADNAYTIVRPNLGLEQMNASFNVKDIVMFTNLLEKDAFTVKSDPTLLRKDTFGLKSDPGFVSLLDMDERLMIMHVAIGRNAEELLASRNIDVIEPIDIGPDKKLVSEEFPSLLKKDTLDEKSSLSSIRSLEMDEKLVAMHLTLGENLQELLSVEIFGANELLDIYPDKKQAFEVFSFHVEDPMSSKLSPSQTVSLSLEPMCNTYRIISRNALIRNHLRSLPSTRRNHSFFSHFLHVFRNYHFGIE